jgi:hypothetical protein
LKIGIIGTRGIPNNYGGFEQLAQHLSLGLKARGHEVYVYNSHRHPYKSDNWNGIHLIAKRDPEHLLGTVGQFVYDFNCILDCRRHRFDVILNLGYTSSSVWMWLFPSSTRVLTNMDGLEWKRSKYNGAVKKFLRYAESLAVKGSEVLIADSVAIQQYLKREYMVESTFIAYGADIFDEPDLTLLDDFGLKPYGYNLLIARMEPENNLRMILDGIAKSTSEMPMLVVGNHKNKYGNYLVSRYAGNKKIVFTGPIYEPRTVNNLRYFSHLYFHGHSVGGTNPSLLRCLRPWAAAVR